MKNKKKGAAKTRPSDERDIRIYLSPVMLIMAVFFVAFGMAYEFACSLTAVVLHEFAHAKAAKRLGYALNEIRIMPYGAALCGSVDMRPRDEVIIAAAGPLLNLVLGLLFAAMWWLVPSSYLFTETFCKTNVYIGVFNLLPVYPMDGGRMTLAFLTLRLDRKKAYMAVRIISAAIGVAALVLFGISAVYSINICLLSVGGFMILSAFIPDRRARYYALFALAERRKRLERPFEVRRFAVSDSAKLAEMCKALDPDRLMEYDVYDGDMKKMATLSEKLLIQGVNTLGYSASAGELVQIAKRLDFDRH